MSGGVGPTCNDISLPKEEESEQKQSNDATNSSKTNIKYPTTPRKAGFLSFRQLNALAVIIIFSASGMVSPEDFAFVFFSLSYIYFMSKVAFPTLRPSKEPPAAVFTTPEYKLLRLYVFVGAVIGLFLPIAYIFHGIFEGDKEGIKAATPHVFLLTSQVFMEGVAFSDRFSLPIRAFVPVCYNARRIFTIVDWLRSELVSKVDEEYGGSKTRLYVGTGLAIANLAFWCFNLFGFLLPVYLPRAFKGYYLNKVIRD
ncbi:hypothetical protein FH972_016263 [Carpinus fangiana]|uniref:DUF7733 domain-containing protein n=1 Tax=Carpinus fangiana TaxID=176857 RepID=A0A5N6RIW5_9ROSI|nr:hypothetical protein FH972_016263 [Carpinus fangiana]